MQTQKAKRGINNEILDQPTTGETARTGASRADGDPVVEAVPSNTAINNCNSLSGVVKFLRWGVDSLYVSYQGNLHPEVNLQLADLKRLAQSENPLEQANTQLSIGEHLFEVKDKGSSMFSYVIEDNTFKIQLSRPGKAVPMAYIKLSSEYFTYKTPAASEEALYKVLSNLGVIESSANVSRIDLCVDFSSELNMESCERESWVTHDPSVNSYAMDKHFVGWAIGFGCVMAAACMTRCLRLLKAMMAILFLMP